MRKGSKDPVDGDKRSVILQLMASREIIGNQPLEPLLPPTMREVGRGSISPRRFREVQFQQPGVPIKRELGQVVGTSLLVERVSPIPPPQPEPPGVFRRTSIPREQ